MGHHLVDYLHPFGLLAIAMTLSSYNLLIGTITATLICIYTLVKLINEIKDYKNSKQNNIQRKDPKNNNVD